MKHFDLETIEAALLARNPDMIKIMNRGLKHDKVVRLLDKAGVKGELQPVIDLYCWHNGMPFNRAAAELSHGFFPGESFYMIDLNKAIMDFNFFSEALPARPKLKTVAGRFFPFLWNESTKWLTIDLDETKEGSVALVDIRAEAPCKQVYDSFIEFVNDMASPDPVCPRLLKSETS